MDGETIQDAGPENVEVRSGLVGVVQAQNATLTSSGAGMVAAGENVQVRSGGASAMLAGRDLQIESGGGFLLVSGGQMNVRQGGGQVLISGGPMSIEQGGGVVMVAPSSTLKKSYVVLLLSAGTELQEGSRVLLGTAQAAALGAALGIAFAMLNRLLRGRRNV